MEFETNKLYGYNALKNRIFGLHAYSIRIKIVMNLNKWNLEREIIFFDSVLVK